MTQCGALGAELAVAVGAVGSDGSLIPLLRRIAGSWRKSTLGFWNGIRLVPDGAVLGVALVAAAVFLALEAGFADFGEAAGCAAAGAGAVSASVAVSFWAGAAVAATSGFTCACAGAAEAEAGGALLVRVRKRRPAPTAAPASASSPIVTPMTSGALDFCGGGAYAAPGTAPMGAGGATYGLGAAAGGA
jgi:hypothetical protein